MSDSRTVILGHVREALRTAYLPDAPATLPPDAPPGVPPDGASLVGRFIEALAAAGGEARRAADETAARGLLLELLGSVGAGAALVWPDEELPMPIAPVLAAAGIAVADPRLDGDAAVRRRQLAALDGVGVGVTGAMAGLADTGTLALLSGARRPMTASLMPPLHVALLREADILPDMATFLARYPAAALTGSRNLVFITGPSRTADIEMVLTRGVHGPKRLVVVVFP